MEEHTHTWPGPAKKDHHLERCDEFMMVGNIRSYTTLKICFLEKYLRPINDL